MNDVGIRMAPLQGVIDLVAIPTQGSAYGVALGYRMPPLQGGEAFRSPPPFVFAIRHPPASDCDGVRHPAP